MKKSTEIVCRGVALAFLLSLCLGLLSQANAQAPTIVCPNVPSEKTAECDDGNACTHDVRCVPFKTEKRSSKAEEKAGQCLHLVKCCLEDSDCSDLSRCQNAKRGCFCDKSAKGRVKKLPADGGICRVNVPERKAKVAGGKTGDLELSPPTKGRKGKDVVKGPKKEPTTEEQVEPEITPIDAGEAEPDLAPLISEAQIANTTTRIKQITTEVNSEDVQAIKKGEPLLVIVEANTVTGGEESSQEVVIELGNVVEEIEIPESELTSVKLQSPLAPEEEFTINLTKVSSEEVISSFQEAQTVDVLQNILKSVAEAEFTKTTQPTDLEP